MSEIQSSNDGPLSVRDASQISLVDLLDRLLGTGVVLAGDVLISLAGVDLVQVRLHALITTVRADMPGPRNLQGGTDG
jgi:hypothetical protein